MGYDYDTTRSVIHWFRPLGPPGRPAPSFIVAEISKNWPDPAQNPRLISQQFEAVIATNEERGYALVSFDLDRLALPDGTLNETIIAVFRRVEG